MGCLLQAPGHVPAAPPVARSPDGADPLSGELLCLAPSSEPHSREWGCRIPIPLLRTPSLWLLCGATSCRVCGRMVFLSPCVFSGVGCVPACRSAVVWGSWLKQISSSGAAEMCDLPLRPFCCVQGKRGKES